MDKYQQQFENEVTLIGCYIKDNSLFKESKLTAEHFSDRTNQNLFGVMLQMIEQKEIVSLESLRSLPDVVKSGFGGYEHIKNCYEYAISVHSFEWLHKSVLEFNSIEQARRMANEFLINTNELNSTVEVLEFQKKLDEINFTHGSNVKTSKQLLSEVIQKHSSMNEKGLSGADTGFLNINRVTDGWQDGDLIIIGARPSLGKTALSLNCLVNGIKKNVDQYGTFFSCEMTEQAIMNRIISYESGVNLGKLRNPNKLFAPDGSDSIKYQKGLNAIEKYLDRLSIRNETNVIEIRAAIRKIIRDNPNKKHVFYIDHLDHVTTDKHFNNKVHEVGEIVKQLKKICKEFKVPIVLLAQLNRAVEKQENKRPMMSDLRESGTIEQVADVIALLYRDSYYNKEEKENPKFEILIRKQRDGVTGDILLNFYPALSKFTDYVY